MKSLSDRCREMLRAGTSVDEVLALMRREGKSHAASMSLLIELTGMSVAEAKSAVHHSRAWADQKVQIEDFHRDLEQAADKLDKDKPLKKN